jgi:hypothetical protein
MTDEEKAQKVREGFSAFVLTFGTPDIYNRIVLEQFFEVIFNEGISLPGETGWDSNQDDRPSEE